MSRPLTKVKGSIREMIARHGYSGRRWLRRRAATFTPASSCTSVSCCQAARIWSKRFRAHDEGTDGVSSVGDEDQGGCSTRKTLLAARKCCSCRRSTSSQTVTSSPVDAERFRVRKHDSIKRFVARQTGGLAVNPGNTAGPTLRRAARSRTLQEGSSVCCGLSLSPGNRGPTL